MLIVLGAVKLRLGSVNTSRATPTGSSTTLLLCRASSKPATHPPKTSTCHSFSSPSQNRDAIRATSCSQSMPSCVGRWMTAASVPPKMPAAMPAVMPHIISIPEIGTASTFAQSEPTGMPSKVTMMSGATQSCAAIVAASTPAIRRGPRIFSSSGRARNSSPALASTES